MSTHANGFYTLERFRSGRWESVWSGHAFGTQNAYRLAVKAGATRTPKDCGGQRMTHQAIHVPLPPPPKEAKPIPNVIGPRFKAPSKLTRWTPATRFLATAPSRGTIAVTSAEEGTKVKSFSLGKGGLPGHRDIRKIDARILRRRCEMEGTPADYADATGAPVHHGPGSRSKLHDGTTHRRDNGPRYRTPTKSEPVPDLYPPMPPKERPAPPRKVGFYGKLGD